jgi:sarcosine oxidase gamma subunit
MMPLEFEVRAPCERLGLKGPRAEAWLAALGIPVPAAPNSWVCDARGMVRMTRKSRLAPQTLGAPDMADLALAHVAQEARKAPKAHVAHVAHETYETHETRAVNAAYVADEPDEPDEPDAADEPDAPGEAVDVVAADDRLLVARLGSAEFFLEDRAAGVAVRDLAQHMYEAPPTGVYPVLREDAAFCLSGDGSLDVLAQVCNIDFADLAFESQPVIMTLMIGVSVLVLPQARGEWRRFRIWCDPTFGEYLGGSLGQVVLECGGRFRR